MGRAFGKPESGLLCGSDKATMVPPRQEYLWTAFASQETGHDLGQLGSPTGWAQGLYMTFFPPSPDRRATLRLCLNY